MRTFLSLVILSNLILLHACDPSTGPETKRGRVVYFTVDGDYQSDSLQSGLYYFCAEKSGLRMIAANKIIHITGTSIHGKILFVYESLSRLRYWKYCENGKLMLTYLPVFEREGIEFSHYEPPYYTLSYGRRHTGFFLEEKPEDNDDPCAARISLIIYCFCIDDKQQFYLDEHLLRYFEGADLVRPGASNIAVSRDAEKAWFVAEGIRFDDSKEIVVSRRAVEYDNGIFRVSETIGEDLSLCGMCPENGMGYFRAGEQILTFGGGNQEPCPLTPENLSNPRQFATDAGKIAVWTNDGIGICNYDSPEIETTITYEYIDAEFGPHLHSPNKCLSIAPDGKRIVFTLPKEAHPEASDLFMAKIDGSDIRLLAENMKIGMAVISQEVELKE